MYKRLLKQVRYLRFLDNYPRLKLGTFLVAIFCAFLVVVATFTQLQLGLITIPEDAFLKPVEFFSKGRTVDDFIKIFYYIPQVPVVLFAGALLGPGIGIVSLLMYLIAGIIGIPLFASGGGLGYYSDLGFGYILGYFVGIFLVGNILSAKISSFSLMRAAVVGVLAVHLFGILYLTSLLLLQHESILTIFGWIWAKSGMQLPYDILISFVTIAIARPVRAILWLAMD